MIIPSPLQPRGIVYDGLVTETRHERADGITVVKQNPPVRTFFIDYLDQDGEKIGVWDGLSYSDACAAAHEWQRDGALVDDRVSDEGGCV